MKETRKAQHLRILQFGPRHTPEDYREVQYLRDQGLADAEIQLSFRKENYGQPIKTVWIGPTSSGWDYLDELTATNTEPDSQQLCNNPHPNDATKGDTRSPEKQKPAEILKRGLSDLTWSTAKTVVGFIAAGTAAFVLASHFDVFQYLMP